MPKLRLLLVLVVAATAAAVMPSAASADSVTPVCDGGTCGTGWHTSAVHVTWTIDPDPPDGGTDCAPFDIGEAQSEQTFTCTATFGGTPVQGAVSQRVDTTPPAFLGSGGPTRPPDFGTWYNHPVSVAFSWDGGTSGFGACGTSVPYSGPSNPGVHATSSCKDGAGNSAGPVDSPPFNYDDGPPVGVVGALSRGADHNGWFNHAVPVAFSGSDPGSGISSCTSATYSGPDSAVAAVPGSCTNGAGLTADGAPVVIKYDDTAPSVTGAAADRPADSNGWYNHPVTFAFHGSDGASGIAGCSSATYSGPDDSTASLRGSCSDNAGNSAGRTISFKFDEHAPEQSKFYAVPANKSIDLSWSPPSDGASFTITRAPAVGATAPTLVYQGGGTHFVDTGLENGKKYNYVLTTFDAAGNGRVTGKSAVPDGSTLRPFIDTEVSKPPRLTWGKVRKARYYNVQLFKGRKKILSTWPKGPSLRLKSSWRYNGKKVRLTSGLYRWYVWPGYGSMRRHKYGDLVGSSTFRLIK